MGRKPIRYSTEEIVFAFVVGKNSNRANASPPKTMDDRDFRSVTSGRGRINVLLQCDEPIPRLHTWADVGATQIIGLSAFQTVKGHIWSSDYRGDKWTLTENWSAYFSPFRLSRSSRVWRWCFSSPCCWTSANTRIDSTILLSYHVRENLSSFT